MHDKILTMCVRLTVQHIPEHNVEGDALHKRIHILDLVKGIEILSVTRGGMAA